MSEAEELEDEQPAGVLGKLGQEVDWEGVVRKHPIPAVLIAVVGGFILGRTKGDWVLGAVSAFAAAQISRQVNELLGDEVL